MYPATYVLLPSAVPGDQFLRPLPRPWFGSDHRAMTSAPRVAILAGSRSASSRERIRSILRSAVDGKRPPEGCWRCPRSEHSRRQYGFLSVGGCAVTRPDGSENDAQVSRLSSGMAAARSEVMPPSGG
jgi:hypothetical protein